MVGWMDAEMGVSRGGDRNATTSGPFDVVQTLTRSRADGAESFESKRVGVTPPRTAKTHRFESVDSANLRRS